MKKIIFLLLLSNGLHAQKLTSTDLKLLCQQMSGAFNSTAQSKKDTSYFDITLHMKPIWTNRDDGYWLYVEQAVTTMQDKPYRQRVYHVYLFNDSTIISQVYELKSPKDYIGAWKEKEPLSTLNTGSLEIRDGCAIYLQKKSDDAYSGSTPRKECISNLRGAAYATSEVEIRKNMILSWDRGWDKEDNQVWGAEKGGYEFIKEKNYRIK
ncbi:MAG: chromophore lyase CpcT/CpeT [Bacteroidetes bacterium]|nr:chromophore lyase CpcT/CpeT [Bacteroidota bacterium]